MICFTCTLLLIYQVSNHSAFQVCGSSDLSDLHVGIRPLPCCDCLSASGFVLCLTPAGFNLRRPFFKICYFISVIGSRSKFWLRLLFGVLSWSQLFHTIYGSGWLPGLCDCYGLWSGNPLCVWTITCWMAP